MVHTEKKGLETESGEETIRRKLLVGSDKWSREEEPGVKGRGQNGLVFVASFVEPTPDPGDRIKCARELFGGGHL